MKNCGVCHRSQPESEFYARGRGGLRSECKACNKAHQRSWRKANRAHVSAWRKKRYDADPQPARERAVAYGARNRDKINARARMRNTGWTAEQFASALSAQSGQCAICSCLLRRGRGKSAAAADHDHETGAPRGLLCTECNCGVGCFRDNPDLLKLAGQYLDEWKKRSRVYT